jgi:hypothetical protein
VNDLLSRCLEDLDRRIDPRTEQAYLASWDSFLDGTWESRVYSPPYREPAVARVDWPRLSVNQAFEDPTCDRMVLHQLGMLSRMLEEGGNDPLNVRCNYSTGIMPSLFGCEMFLMDERTNTLPTAVPYGSRDQIRRLLDEGVPDPRSGLGDIVLRCGLRFRELFEPYENLSRFVEVYHPDVQGPIDIVEVVWGSDMFLGFYDCPDLVRDFLDLVAQTYEAFMDAWYEQMGLPASRNGHWKVRHDGALMLREDSLMNLSPELYREFILPVDRRLLDRFGGGAVHFCGRGDHYIEPLCQLEGVSGIAMSQPELNDMEKIYRATVDQGIFLLDFPSWAAVEALEAGRATRGRMHVRQMPSSREQVA